MTTPVESQGVTHGWMGASVWLVFLAFPLATALTDESNSGLAKASATALLLAFSAVYIWSFRQLIRHEALAHAGGAVPAEPGHGRLAFTLLVVIGIGLYAVIDLPALGVVPFVVAFTAFHFSWTGALVAFAASLGATIVIPLLEGALDDLWFFPIIVLAVGGGTLLMRTMEEQQLEQARLRTQLAVTGERNRVARDVHDVLGHSLTAVILKADLSQRLLDDVRLDGSNDDRDRERLVAARAQLGELAAVSRGALAEIRSTVGGLRHADLADEVSVARSVLADAGVELMVTGDVGDIDGEHRALLAWVVREAITNIVRHASATRCHIELAAGGTPSVLMRISDDGVGIADSADTSGNGLRGMRERIEAAGATLTIRSAGGTQLEVTQ